MTITRFSNKKIFVLALAIFVGIVFGLGKLWAALSGGASAHLGLLAKSDKPRLVASLPRSHFIIGESIPVRTEFHNETTYPFTIWSSGYWANHWIRVVGSDGREPQLTSRGKLRRQLFSPIGNRDKNSPVKLEGPLRIWHDGVQNLNALFVLTPGTYRVTVIYEDGQPPTPLKLVSNTLRFSVE